MLLLVIWRLKATGIVKEVTDAQFQKTYTDFGVCCRIFPQLDFDNPATKDLPAEEYDSKAFMDLKPGARNGIKNGISFLIDVETYEYAFFPRSAKGFTIALSDSRDRPVISQQGEILERQCLTVLVNH